MLLRACVLAVGLILLSAPIAADLIVALDKAHEDVDVAEDGRPVLRCSFGPTTPPAGIGPEFVRGDYISALYGPSGELIPADSHAEPGDGRSVCD